MQGFGGQFMWRGGASGKWHGSSDWPARRRPKLGPWQTAIDAILQEDKSRPRRQRHTAKRIFERLREEYGYTGGYTIVKDYVRQLKLGTREMFVPLSHTPGEAQADFGEALVVVAGVECEAHYLAFDLPHSDDCFVVAFPAETTDSPSGQNREARVPKRSTGADRLVRARKAL